ncbi:MAG: histidine phosphatase family protein [Bacteroidales bacterium]|nr:histidine phosphatase family protein [Bacteroidales bacterium]
MKKLFFLLAAAVLSFSPVRGQDVRTRLQENPERYGGVHHSYEAPAELVDTPAPKGYEPFYVSHYGRHGSRYLTSMNSVTRVSHLFDGLDSLGVLSAEGVALHEALKALEQSHEDQAGYLTLRGGREHQAIAQRLYERVPAVFNQLDRGRVIAESSYVQRCIQSLANFTMVLKADAPQLRFDVYAGERFMKHISPGTSAPRNRSHNAVFDSVLNARLDPTRAMNAWFTDPWAAAQHLGKYSVRQFVYYVFYAGGINQCLTDDYDLPSIHRFFTEEELYNLWYCENLSHFDSMANTLENNCRFNETGRKILADFVKKADAAVAGNDVAADLRFGHDSGLLPLLSYLRLEGYEKTVSMTQAAESGWYSFEQMPMGSNLQMIFYRDKKGDVLVKILRNEHETTIPALKPYKGPYYRWKDLRAYFVSLP